MLKIKTIALMPALILIVGAIVGCNAVPGGAPPAPTAAPAAPVVPVAPTSAGALGGATAVPQPAAPTSPPTAPPTQQAGAPTEAPPRISPTPPPAGTPDPGTLAASAGPKCEAAFSNPVPPLQNVGAPEAPVLVMFNKEYEGRTWVYNPITSIRYATDANNVRSLLCIVETRKMTDKYPDGSPLYQVTWEARLLKWPEGNVLRVRAGILGSQIFTQFPKPSGSEFYGSRPEGALVDFVKEALGGG